MLKHVAAAARGEAPSADRHAERAPAAPRGSWPCDQASEGERTANTAGSSKQCPELLGKGQGFSLSVQKDTCLKRREIFLVEKWLASFGASELADSRQCPQHWHSPGVLGLKELASQRFGFELGKNKDQAVKNPPFNVGDLVSIPGSSGHVWM